MVQETKGSSVLNLVVGSVSGPGIHPCLVICKGQFFFNVHVGFGDKLKKGDSIRLECIMGERKDRPIRVISLERIRKGEILKIF